MFADDFKIVRTVTSAIDCILRQTDMDSICGWCAVNSTKVNCDKTSHYLYREN